jgi:hypothetical protein
MAFTLARFESDFYLWGRLKTIMYAAPVDSEEAFYCRSVDASQTTRSYTGIFELMLRSMRRAEAFIKSHGGHFGRLL